MSSNNVDRVWSIEKITERLEGLGCENVTETISDVTEIVSLRIFSAVLNKLPYELKNELQQKSDSDIKEYFELHPEKLPLLTKAEIFAIEDRAWSDYFKAIDE